MVNFKSNNQKRSKEFVLALGGGGGCGLAHLGVLKALEEHNIKPAAVIGISMEHFPYADQHVNFYNTPC